MAQIMDPFKIVLKNSSVFWGIRPCSPLKVNPQILHGVISQKIVLFITTAVRTS
jgi:hypothetical protein